MPLTLVTGPANAAKAGEVLAGYRARLDQEPVLVVPGFRDADHAQRELSAHGAVFGTRVLRFARLFEMVAERCDAEVRAGRRATAVQRELIVERAVDASRLRTLSEAAARPGFARAAGRFFAEVGRAMVDPGRLRSALRAWAGDGARRDRAEDLASLYSAYRGALDEAGLVDDQLFATRALEALRREPARWGGTAVFAYGFDDFTEVELALLRALADDAGADVTVSLPYEHGRAAFAAIDRTHDRLAEAASRTLPLPPSSEHYHPSARPLLHHLERRLFEEAGERVDPDGALRLLRAGGARAEAELVAAEVLALLRSGTAPGQIAVVFRSTSGYESLVDQVFTAYGIPYALDRTVTLANTSLGSGVLALLRCACGSATADDLLTYLRTPGRLDEPAPADRLEAEVRRAGDRTAEQARKRWEEQGRPLHEIDRLGAARGAATLAAQLDAEAEDLFGRPYRRRAHLFSHDELEDARAREALREALRGVTRLATAAPGLAPEPRRLHDLLAGLEVFLGADPAPDRVQVARPEAIRARRFDAVFVCGLQEGEFPRPARPEPFLSDDERRNLARASGVALPLHDDRAARERYLFYSCVSRAERLLALSWRDTDEEGAAAVRSFLVEDVLDQIDSAAVDAATRSRPLSAVAWPADDAPTELEWRRAEALAGPRREPGKPDRLDSEEVLEHLRARDRVSAAALESYADCPVKWLVEQELAADSLEPDPEPLVRGRYAHTVLEVTYRRLRERTGKRRVTPENLAEAEEILIAALREQQSQFRISPAATRVRTAVRRLEFDLLRHLAEEAKSGSWFEPAELELEFGREGSLEPSVSIGGGLRVRGRIDRVDTWDGYALVRDYKSGKTVHAVATWERDRRLQVALYMLAARELMSMDLAGGVYVPLAGDERRPRGLVAGELQEALGDGFFKNDFRSAAEIDDELERARGRARELAARMRSGDVSPCPKTCAWNGGCAYPSICRTER
ncbi:MAG: PD-(D/E)XK nuclease family protein [Actinobacteria bacterium]|nr:PD-(D/E)XK nuclease family protein [Actinomycetota bacterium]